MTHPAECLKGVRRPSRLGAVWLAYRTNWTVWPLVIVMGVFFVFAGFPSWSRYLTTDLALPPEMPMPPPTDVVRAVSFTRNGDMVTDHPVDWKQLRSITAERLTGCRPLWTPGALPHLEAATVSLITDDELIKLCELYDLKSLSLYDSGFGLTSAGWQAVSRETSLENFELKEIIGGGAKLMDLPAIDWPPNLKTLFYSDSRGASLERFREWQKLQQLTCLSTNLPSDQQQVDQVTELLQSFPSLTELYVLEGNGIAKPGSMTKDQFHRFSTTVRLTSPSRSIKIHWTPRDRSPFSLEMNNEGRINRIGTIFGIEFVVILFLILQMSAQCDTAGSVLMPRLMRANCFVTAIIFLITMLIAFALFLIADCSPLAVLGLCGTPMFVLALTIKLLRGFNSSIGAPPLWFSHLVTLIPIIYLPPTLYVLGRGFFRTPLNEFLSGQHFWVSWILLAGSIWGFIDAFSWLARLRRELEAAGVAHLTLDMYDFKGLRKWSTDMQAARYNSGRSGYGPERLNDWIAGFGDQRLETRLDQSAQRTQKSALFLWRMGNGGGVIWDVIQVLLLIALACFPLIAPLAGVELSSIRRLQLVFSIPPFVVFSFIVSFTRLWNRQPMLEMEILRPSSRKAWIRNWYLGFAAEVAPILAALVINGLIWLFIDSSLRWGPVHGLLLTIFLFGVVGIGYAVLLLSFTDGQRHGLRSLLANASLVALLFFASFSFFVTPILMEMFQGREIELLSASYFIPRLVGVYAVAFLVLWLAHRRWQQWEVGRTA